MIFSQNSWTLDVKQGKETILSAKGNFSDTGEGLFKQVLAIGLDMVRPFRDQTSWETQSQKPVVLRIVVSKAGETVAIQEISSKVSVPLAAKPKPPGSIIDVRV